VLFVELMNAQVEDSTFQCNKYGDFDKVLSSPEFIILMPTDSVINDLPVLIEKPHTDSISMFVHDLFESSYMYNAVRFYYLAQIYLMQAGEIDQLEPAYLLLSNNQGGFPKFGFYLQQGDSIIDKSSAPYIELVKNNTNSEDYLGSMTQIYPHEMGHVIYHLLADDSDSIVPGAVDIHYSTLTTDYRTGFNEGFAMHFENMAREFDPDTGRISKILEDFEYKKEKTKHAIGAFERDFSWPLRLGLFRTTMILWYQNFEDIKRFEWVNENRIKYQNTSRIFNDPEKSLCYRNSGISTTSELRNPQQLFATEGVIASFFLQLIRHDFHVSISDSLFLKAHSLSNLSLTSFEIQYLKIFHVLFKHVNFSLTEKSQFLDFIEGYCNEFPEEIEKVNNIFNQVTGYDYPLDPGPELWIINPNHEHGILVMEQFGGITLPYYTFNLNAAGVEDLLTFPSIDLISAKKIIDQISTLGPLNEYNDLHKIEGLSSGVVDTLISNKFYPGFFEDFDEYSLNLSLNSLFYSNGMHLLKMLLIYLLVTYFIGFILYKSLAKQRFGLKQMVLFFFWLLLFTLFALASIILLASPVLVYLIGSVLVVGLQYIFLRKTEKRYSAIFTCIFIAGIVFYSLI